ncbi:MAG: SCO family protein [Ignavibacteria bacterium]|nr:SCO family protein [Ignavibacteria bacterium]
MKKILLLFQILFLLSLTLKGNKEPEVGIVEKLGNKIPLDLVFTNEEGKQVKLANLINKPTILMFVYYHCPGICSPLLTGVSEVVDKSELVPGKDYQLVTISFDHTETFDKAKKWKENHIKGLEKKIDKNSWAFLVGDSISIRKITNAVGFYFKPDGRGDFVHGAAIYSISPDGKIIRYLFGTEFNPFDFKMAVLEAEKGIPLPTVNRLLKFCYSYDPSGRTYVFNFTRVFGTVMLLGLAVFFVILISKKKKKNSEE